MAKLMIVALLVAVSVAVMAAPPAYEYEPFESNPGEYELYASEDDHLRFRRVTCDLLSVGGFLGDSACAANCLSMGKAGGSCHGGVCVCRKEKIKDLWDKRFG